MEDSQSRISGEPGWTEMRGSATSVLYMVPTSYMVMSCSDDGKIQSRDDGDEVSPSGGRDDAAQQVLLDGHSRGVTGRAAISPDRMIHRPGSNTWLDPNSFRKKSDPDSFPSWKVAVFGRRWLLVRSRDLGGQVGQTEQEGKYFLIVKAALS